MYRSASSPNIRSPSILTSVLRHRRSVGVDGRAGVVVIPGVVGPVYGRHGGRRVGTGRPHRRDIAPAGGRIIFYLFIGLYIYLLIHLKHEDVLSHLCLAKHQLTLMNICILHWFK